MGSYNGTCGITQLPILEGDRVVQFILIEKETFGHYQRAIYTESNAEWDIVPMPIYGKANDYGSQKDDPGSENMFQVLSKHFANRIVRIREKDKSMREWNFDNPFHSRKTLETSITHQLHALKSLYGGVVANGENASISYRRFSTFTVHAGAYKALTDDFLMTYPEDNLITKEELIESVERYMQFRDKLIQDIPKTKGDGSVNIERIMAESGRRDSDYMQSFFKKEKLEYYGHPLFHILNYAFGEISVSEGGTVIGPWRREVGFSHDARGLVESVLFLRGMDALRKLITPQCGAGSQSTVNRIHDKIYEFTGQQIAAIRNRYED